MKKKWKQHWIRCIILLGFIVNLVLFLDKEVLANEKKGILQVEYLVHTEKENLVLTNTEFVLYEVGTFQNGQRILHKELLASGVDLNVKDSSEQKKISERLFQFLKEKDRLYERKFTDENGIARFDVSEQKTYLLAQTKPITYDHRIQYMTTPTLVDVKKIDEITLFKVSPKSEWQLLFPPVKPENPEIVQTGDQESVVSWMLLGMYSFMLMIRAVASKENK